MAWANQSKSTDSFSNQAKNASVFSQQEKHSSTHTNETMNSGLFFLLQEIGDYLLQENGYRILLDDSIDWGLGTKNSSSFVNLAKH